MTNLHIIIPGDCAIKKNSMQKMFFRKDAQGRPVPLKFPIYYYDDKYKKWAKEAVQALAVFKSKNTHIKFPLTGSYFVSFWFFRSRDAYSGNSKLDVSNLMEAPQDALAGNAGNFLDSGKNKYDHSIYQILDDDNCKVITSHPTCKVFFDPVKPRTEIFITEFDLKKFADIHKYIYGNVQLPVEYQPDIFSTIQEI